MANRLERRIELLVEWEPLSILGGLIVFLAARLTIRVRQTGKGGSPVHRMYWRMRSELVHAGVPHSASVTPIEFLWRAEEQLVNDLPIQDVLREATRVYLIGTYSDHTLSGDDIRVIEASWNRFWIRRAVLILKNGGRRIKMKLRTMRSTRKKMR